MTEGATPGPYGPAPGEPPQQGTGGPAYGPPPAGPPGAPGYGYPQAPPPAAGGGGYAQPLVTIGDITVTADGIVTPAGTLPLRGAVWTVTDMSRTEEKIPTHAIVLAVVFFVFCFLGLLFLLMKEKATTGHVQVTVNSGGRFHSTMIPVAHPGAVYQINEQVNYARSVSV